MKVEIITTGDEVMQGIIVDTNTSWIAERLSRLGHEVVRHESVGDDEIPICDVLVAAASRADAVVVTGGLGTYYGRPYLDECGSCIWNETR